MRISDWSSDVCSSDLDAERPVDDDRGGRHPLFERGRIDDRLDRRSRLTHRLRRPVERLDTRIEAALHREDAPGIGLIDDHAVRYRGDAAQRPGRSRRPAPHDVAGFKRGERGPATTAHWPIGRGTCLVKMCISAYLSVLVVS